MRVKPIIPAAIRNDANTALVNQASIDTTIIALNNYNDAYNAIARLIDNSTISDAHMYYVKLVIEDHVAAWKRLKEKFEKKIEVEAKVAQLQLLNF